MERLLILGTGGHAAVALDIALAKYTESAIAFISPETETVFSITESQCRTTHIFPVVAEHLLFSADRAEHEHTFVAVGDNAKRNQLYWRLKNVGYPVISLIHETAVISRFADIGDGVMIGAAAIVNARAHIGHAAIINSGTVVEHDCCLHEAVHIAPAACLGGGVEIGARSLIGIGARILPGITIGNDVVVAAGAVVTTAVADGVIVKGVPARVHTES